VSLCIIEKSKEDSVYGDDVSNVKTISLHLLKINLYHHYYCLHRPLFCPTLDSICLDHDEHSHETENGQCAWNDTTRSFLP